MADNEKEKNDAQSGDQDFVTVTFADDWELACEYKELLSKNDIPVVITKLEGPYDESPAMAVTVPEDYLDEAHVLIQSQAAYNDFYDLAFEDDEITDFQDGLDNEDDF